MSGPLAIDLCCGLAEAKVRGRANASIDKLVARWTKHPEHVPLGIADERPGTVASKLRLVRDLQYARFTAAFAGIGNVRVPTPHPIEFGVFVRPPSVVSPLARWIAARPHPAQFAGRVTRALGRAISLVGARRNDVEVFAAARAIFPRCRDIRLLAAPTTPNTLAATFRAIELIRPLGLERCGTISAGQVVHSGAVA